MSAIETEQQIEEASLQNDLERVRALVPDHFMWQLPEDVNGPDQEWPIRIKEILLLDPNELKDNEGNWRLHPAAQKAALRGALRTRGIAGVLYAYPSEREGGRLTLIDGHARKGETKKGTRWPVAVLDLNDEEADAMLADYDPIAAMAETDGKALLALTERILTDDLDVRETLRKLEAQANAAIEAQAGADEKAQLEEMIGPEDMELLPFEHYDYLMLIFRKTWDWEQAIELFHLQKVQDPRVRSKKAIGLARGIDGTVILSIIRELKDKVKELELQVKDLEEHGRSAGSNRR